MTTEGKSPLDHATETADATRSAQFTAIERQTGEDPGAREMALTRRPRAEDPALRAKRFVEVERRGEG
jgi:hypothetical protein